jgi:glucose-6-phosphate-specific signal transduction histidine kinase
MTFSLRLDEPADAATTRHRSLVVLAIAGALFLVILTARMLVGDAEDAYSMFYVLPVALVATSFGMRPGAAAGAVAIGLIVLWAVARHVTLTPTGWGSRAVPILLLGVLLGEASDRIRRVEAERQATAAAARLHRQAIEINDSLVQGMAAAKWSLEAGQTETGLKTLNDTITRAHDLVSGLIREAGLGGDSAHLPGRD